MPKEIRQSFFIDAPPGEVGDALMREEHLQRWWTSEARVNGNAAVLGWSGHGWVVELQMTRSPGGHIVAWACTRSNMQNTDAWEGTTITFSLVPQARGTRVDFSQTGYRESPCYDACSRGWEFFLGTSLKRYLETGTGMPYPEMPDTSELTPAETVNA